MKNLILFFAFISCTFTVFASPINYWLDIDQPEHHLAKVTVELNHTAETPLTVSLPAWRTGRYTILNLANGIRDFSARDAKGRTLEWQKSDKNSWKVFAKRPGKITLTYRVYANQLGYRSRFIDDSQAFINASGFFVFSEQYRKQPIAVRLSLPTAWQSISGLDSGVKKHSFIATDYDQLVDSPIQAGIYQLTEFNLEGRLYQLVFWGRGNYQIEKTAKDFEAMLKISSDFVPKLPFKRYVMMVHATTDVRGATEFANSTVIQRMRYTFEPRDNYIDFMATVAHELIHSWNVKAYRPAGLVPYKYGIENYTNLLWIAEGSTSYFEYLMLLRAGIITTDEYLTELAEEVEEHLNTPGTQHQSANQASFDAWIDEGGDRKTNASVSIYDEGALLSLLLDLDLLDKTQAKHGFIDVHKALYRDFSLPNSYTETDVLNILKQLSGQSYVKWWQQYPQNATEYPLIEVLAKAGLQANYQDEVMNIGLSVFKEDGLNTIRTVLRNSPAWQAGLTPYDQIVAINGLKVYPGQLDKRFADFSSGDELELTIFRRDELTVRKLILPETTRKDLKLEAVENPTELQQQIFKAWTGQDYSSIGDEESD